MTAIVLLWILCGCPTGLWASDCVIGKYKQNDVCKPCPRSCSKCISDVICTACKPGYYGDICMEQCSESCGDRKCLQENGQCVSCAAGYYFSSNKTCVKCPEHCTYCQSQDICTACKNGFTGSICQDECTNCNPVSGCNIETKVCFAGCKDGYSDPTCVKSCASNCKSCEPTDASKCTSCASGRYGGNCNTCPNMCRDSKCNDDNGDCTHGCKEGFWGSRCEKMCSKNCRQGICNQTNGFCSDGCHGNFTGNMCHCPSDCECKSDETCEQCRKNSSFVCNSRCSKFCAGSICSNDTQLKCLYGCREGYRDILCGSSDSPEISITSTVIVVCVTIAVIATVIIVAIIRWRKQRWPSKYHQPSQLHRLNIHPKAVSDPVKFSFVMQKMQPQICRGGCPRNGDGRRTTVTGSNLDPGVEDKQFYIRGTKGQKKISKPNKNGYTTEKEIV